MASQGAQMPFIKNLASSDRKIRTQALESLKAFLSVKYGGPAAGGATTLSVGDAEKLWAGLFYAVWMADRAPTQQKLCDELAGVPAAVGLPDAAVAAWLVGFWATMARQWTTGIDVLRMDKFMLLVRRVMAQQLAWMAGVDSGHDAKKQKTTARSGSSSGSSTTYPAVAGLKVLEDWPFNADGEAPVTEGGSGGGGGSSGGGGGDDDDVEADDDMDDAEAARQRHLAAKATIHVPVGLAIHAVDIWVDEAEKLGLLEEEEEKAELGGVDTLPEGEDDDDNDGDDGAAKSVRPGNPSLVRRINTLVEHLAARIPAPAVRQRAREALADERLPWNRNPSATGTRADSGGGGIEGQAGNDDDDDGDDASWDGFND